MSELVFYTNPQSRGRIAHWMLEEFGEPYRTVWLDYGAAMKDTAYLAINPMGKVPALVHDGSVLTEAAAICVYLADRFPDKGLMPPAADPARAAFFRWTFFAAGPLEQAVTAKALGWQVPEGRSSMVGFGSLAQTLAALEQALSPGPYLCGARFTAADVYVGASLGWAMLFGTIEPRPAFTRYVADLEARPAAQRAKRLNEERIKARAG